MILDVDRITKIYGNRFSRICIRALHEFSLSVERGEIMCIKGSNGSGKSTLLRCIVGLLRPSAGKITISYNYESKSLSPRVGYCPDNPQIYQNVTIFEFLTVIAKILRIKSEKSLLIKYLDEFMLEKWINEPIGSLSKGMLHKTALITSMMDHPQLLVLDEPFSSLDGQSISVLTGHLRMLASEGTSIIFTDPISGQTESFVDTYISLDNTRKEI